MLIQNSHHISLLSFFICFSFDFRWNKFWKYLIGPQIQWYAQMAIADATLQYMVQMVKCKTLFITHYLLLATCLEKNFLNNVENLHMGYDSETRIDGTWNITFFYKLIMGLATGVFRSQRLVTTVRNQVPGHTRNSVIYFLQSQDMVN